LHEIITNAVIHRDYSVADDVHIRIFDNNGSVLGQLGLYESWWSGGYDVAATEGFSVVGTGGNRRSSVRLGPI
jgi:hypothetical protein